MKLTFALILTFLPLIVISETTLKKGIDSFDHKDYALAIVTFKEIIKNEENNDEALFYLGKSYLKTDNYEEAIDQFENAIEINDKNAEYYFYLGESLAEKAKNSGTFKRVWLAPKLRRAYEKTISLDPTHVKGHMRLAQFYMIAPSIMGGDMEKAYALSRKVIEMDKVKGTLLLARVYKKEDKPDSVAVIFKLLDQEAKQDSSYLEFYYYYGHFLLKRKKMNEALQKFKILVEISPKNPYAYDSLGDGYIALKDTVKAIDNYRKALKLDEDFKRSKKKLKELGEIND